jgi:hypothetical protein
MGTLLTGFVVVALFRGDRLFPPRGATASGLDSSASGASPEGFSRIGNWLYGDRINKIDDTRSPTAFLQSRDHASTLALHCRGIGPITVSVHMTEDLGGSAPNRRVRYRFDTEPHYSRVWHYLRGAVLEYDPFENNRLIEQLTKATRFVFEAVAHDDRGVQAEFELTGADRALARLIQACRPS